MRFELDISFLNLHDESLLRNFILSVLEFCFEIEVGDFEFFDEVCAEDVELIKRRLFEDLLLIHLAF